MTSVRYNKTNKTITLTRGTVVNISVAILFMFAGALITATITFQNLRNQVDHNQESVGGLQETIGKLQSDNTNTKVQLSAIQTQLQSIDANILEIKQELQ